MRLTDGNEHTEGNSERAFGWRLRLAEVNGMMRPYTALLYVKGDEEPPQR